MSLTIGSGESGNGKHGRRARRGSGLALAAGAAAALLLGASLATSAAFTDATTAPDGEVTTATVVFGGDRGESLALEYTGLVPGEPRTGTLTVEYDGTIPAELELRFRSDEASVFCTAGGEPKPGGGLLVTIDGDTGEYCSRLRGDPVPLGEVTPDGGELTTEITVELAEDSGTNYSGLSVRDRFVVGASNGFTDRISGTIDIGTAGIDESPPATPPECAAEGMTFTPDRIVELTPGQREWDAVEEFGHGAGPFLVVGTDGEDRITGSNKGDCLVGGGGADEITGGNGSDVLVGGAGHDQLYGGNGPDHLDGGPGGATCDGGRGPTTRVDCDVETGRADTSRMTPTPAPEPSESPTPSQDASGDERPTTTSATSGDDETPEETTDSSTTSPTPTATGEQEGSTAGEEDADEQEGEGDSAG
ncbi:hypothetical protein SAMN06265360_11330 [Haloechinothrix alba]|uniref:Hemolysin-type calcium-binding repeat-containing protein n=1 Tax=Haloechinothrix alba TaxID=664784 RepID=A0A238Y2Z0_9PSEU|nr:hypothetical protein [Haloechinothrix alba]SNR64679.1 hypothetical protein SAMN06265360_11330 [Haloechinothrix alba]